MPPSPATEDRSFLDRAVEASIRIGLIALIVFWCFQVVRPFVEPIVWAIILVFLSQPAYRWLTRVLGGRQRLAAAVLVLGALLVLLVPSVLLTTSIIESGTELAARLEAGDVKVPPPPAGVADWPIVGEQVHGYWATASRSLEAALGMAKPQLKAIGSWILSTGVATGFGILMFALSIGIAGVLHAQGDRAAGAVRGLARRLAPERGDELVELTRATVQSVTRGILGVAFIQSFLAGVGFLVAGVPAAGLWALLVLLMAVVQIPPLLVLLPIILYVSSTSATGVAVVFGIWSLAVGLSDNVLKPMLLGRGVEVPMAVIFMGAIGGFILNGIIGLFVGAVLLAVGYTLFDAWLHEVPSKAPGATGASAG
jgi:predicted PurR-regulated permease PerM